MKRKKFWSGSGNDHAADYLKPYMVQNMQLIGSVPHHGCTYQRPHNLLRWLTVRDLETDSPQYEWTSLDSILDVIVASSQHLIFELMRNTSGYFGEDPQFIDDVFNDGNPKILLWKRMVSDVAHHCIDRYGLETVVLSTFKAGVDVLLVVQPAHSQEAATALVKAARSGEIDEAELDRRVLRILRAKAAYFGE